MKFDSHSLISSILRAERLESAEFVYLSLAEQVPFGCGRPERARGLLERHQTQRWGGRRVRGGGPARWPQDEWVRAQTETGQEASGHGAAD